MRLLALDTATEACSAAIFRDGVVDERYEVMGRGHAGRLLPMADELLRAAGMAVTDLDAIAFGRGPGGFTGLRIAAGVAQGLAAGIGKPVLPVSDLAALAAAGARTSGAGRVLACMDARMGQVYWAAFDCSGGAPVAVTEEHLVGSGRRHGCPKERPGSPQAMDFGALPGARDPAAVAADRRGRQPVAARIGHRPHRGARSRGRQGCRRDPGSARVPAQRGRPSGADSAGVIIPTQ